ncbi:hypothetical protein G7K_4722-t1 [Saitoella complicata NRRL Y-17804]|uniref:Uncharacterized protein n=1 Tax=Saitoella complicata (strain BCRC 22490 / CBS 7301 / JCM 7358 / NBRC 10748 / NRRL Y-17804) TaxID=698492 RepID=A0A0E9NLC1_SAICN|nr:hypothetical protein G7K_4722-t1 [Saitoella complicata NRRL Y-17804]
MGTFCGVQEFDDGNDISYIGIHLVSSTNTPKELRLSLQRIKHRLVMPKHHSRVVHPLQPPTHLQTAKPCIVIPRQPTMRMSILIVLLDMELITRQQKRSRVRQVELHDTETGGVAWRVVDGDTGEEVDSTVRAGGLEGLPVEVEVEVVVEVNAVIGFRRDGPESVFQLIVMDPDLDVRALEVLQSTSVIEVEVSDDDVLDILDIIPGSLDRGRQLVFLAVDDQGEDVGDGRGPLDLDVLGTSSLPQNQTLGRVLNQGSDDDELGTSGRSVLVGAGGGVGTAEKPAVVALEVAEVEKPHLRTIGGEVSRNRRVRSEGGCCLRHVDQSNCIVVEVESEAGRGNI